MTPRELLPDVEDWAARLGLRNRSGEYVGPCPVCGGEDRFHVRRGRDGGAAVGCRGCIDGQPPKEKREAFGRVLREAFPERFQSGAGEPPHPPRKPPESRSEPISAPDPGDADTRRKVARRVWNATKPLPGSLAEIFLTARGVGHVAVAPSLRFSPALPHPHAPGRFPCLVAGVQDAHGGFLGVQRTYLDSTGAGKANVEPARASLGSLSGGAVRLSEPVDCRLLLGEGIESTAAAALILDWSGGAFSALGTSGVRALVLPPHVEDVMIAADRDAGGEGQLAAAALAERLEAEGRRHVRIELPPFVGDWNDVLLLAREAS